MNNETLNRLNAFIADCKAEFADKDATIADLLDKLSKTEPIIDEGCVGCAGPCKVVDVSANLQKELDTTMVKLTDSRNRCGYLSTELGLREAEICDLKMYQPDDFWAVVTEKDAMIRQLGKVIEEYRETIQLERIDRAAEKDVINRKYSEDLRKKNATIDEFKTIETRETDRLHKIIDELKDQNIKDLKELYELDKADIDKRDKMIEKQGREISGLMCLRDMYDGLEAELSARKEDSAVLMKVVEATRRWQINETGSANTVMKVYDLVKDHIDATGVPHETPIDESQDIAIVFTYGEIL